MRTIDVGEITKNIKEMCIEANYFLSDDVKCALKEAKYRETSQTCASVIDQLNENIKIAESDMIPVCQDTGMAVVFLKVGQDVHFTGGSLTEAVNEGVRTGYKEGYLRNSVVNDPVERNNTGDNTPAIIHTEIVDGEMVEITLAPKGFGSENMSKTYMLKPADGIEGVKSAVIDTIKQAGPNACPPFVVGVGIGGDFELAAILAKKALTRDIGEKSKSKYRLPYVDALEEELLNEANKTGVGPGGFGGRVTALAVNIETYPTHIAGLPLAVNMCCHVYRHKKRII